MSVIPAPAPAPAPAPVSVNPKADNNNANFVIDAVVMEIASSQTIITASGGDGINVAVEDAYGSAASSFSPSDANGGGAGVDTKMTKTVDAAVNKSKAKIPMLENIIEANVQDLVLQ